MKAAVIGSGLSGLTSAALLAGRGVEVEVFEQNPNIGGVTAFAKKNGYMWEQGPVMLGGFLPGEKVYELLKSMGIVLPTVRGDRGIEMPDYTMWRPDEYSGPYWRREKLKKLFPDEAGNIDAFYKFSGDMHKVHYYNDKVNEEGSIFNRIGLFLAWLKVKKYSKLNAKQLMESFFGRQEIIALFTGILADTCVAPSEIPGLGVPLWNFETAFDKRIPLTEKGKKVLPGYCYIKGGVEKLVDSLAEKIVVNGGKIHTDTEVEKILIEKGRTTGVRLADGRIFSADMVVASGGGKELFLDMVGKENLDDRYAGIVEEYHAMEAVFMLHLGVDFDPLEYQKSPLCYYYKTYDIEGAVKKLRVGEYHEGHDGFLIYVPSAISPEMAPQGHHAMTIYTVSPDTLREGSWEENRDRYADKLIELAEEHIPGLKEHIVEKLIMTPLEFRKLMHLQKCSFGGAITIMDAPCPPHVTPVSGLYFVGAQSESLGGVSGVMMGAKKAFEIMRKIEKF